MLSDTVFRPRLALIRYLQSPRGGSVSSVRTAARPSILMLHDSVELFLQLTAEITTAFFEESSPLAFEVPFSLAAARS